MGNVRLQAVSKHFGMAEVIKDLDLEIANGEFCVFVGPSGCGKSTLLRMIAGLEDITTGRLEIAGRDMTGVGPAGRGTAMVFQSYALYPHMTVAQNINFGLRMTGHPADEIARRTARAAGMLQLDTLLNRKPSQLSGGQRQRVAIGRAIVRDPAVFLFDEPLSNLDASLRVQMRAEISGLHREIGTTMIYVTHDQVEAMTMADKIVVLNRGRVEQAGSPLALYHCPANRFVAGFIGSPGMNFLPGHARSADGRTKVELACGGTLERAQAIAMAEGPMTVGIRPEHARVGRAEGGTFSGVLTHVEFLGSETVLYLNLADGSTFCLKADGLVRATLGETVEFHVPTKAWHLFNPEGIALLNGDLMQ
ncbi:ABC transporter ATP-binding protein [Rhizobium sp. Root1203]|uniref:ABC transporter ATP-binding protein n=1 Tax=Rhizobium sp. Root1203 TaxID=1736427 RepID=UPI00070AE326|nr:sn-glycerol-3-phosphate ABC transporter ATP-binding protein UgpC [Rhizobium sp. Root1203]KQV27115.1 ABC transporter ATP-binding protein [Rhizobium sp. Root1203]